MEPTYPQGTPEYDAYAAELRTELGKFARGEDPYQYRREEMFMPTVPNWIAKAVIVTPSLSGDTITPIVGWRATGTQVIVRTSPRAPERRFYLDGLALVGQPKSFREQRIRLEPPDAPVVVRARRERVVGSARDHVIITIEKQRLQDRSTDAAETAAKLLALRTAVDQALAALAEVL